MLYGTQRRPAGGIPPDHQRREAAQETKTNARYCTERRRLTEAVRPAEPINLRDEAQQRQQPCRRQQVSQQVAGGLRIHGDNQQMKVSVVSRRETRSGRQPNSAVQLIAAIHVNRCVVVIEIECDGQRNGRFSCGQHHDEQGERLAVQTERREA